MDLPDSKFFRDWKRNSIRLPAKPLAAWPSGDSMKFHCEDGSTWRVKEKRGGKWTRRRVKHA